MQLFAGDSNNPCFNQIAFSPLPDIWNREIGNPKNIWEHLQEICYHEFVGESEGSGCGGWCIKWYNMVILILSEYKALVWMLVIFAIAGFSDQVRFQLGHVFPLINVLLLIQKAVHN